MSHADYFSRSFFISRQEVPAGMNTEHPISAPVERKKLLISFLDSDHKERFFNLVEANTDGVAFMVLALVFIRAG